MVNAGKSKTTTMDDAERIETLERQLRDAVLNIEQLNEKVEVMRGHINRNFDSYRLEIV